MEKHETRRTSLTGAQTGILAALRTVLILHVLAVFVQAVFAGEFLSGADGPVFFHEFTAFVILGICLIQIALAAFSRSLWLVISTVFIFLAEGLQVGTGFARFLDVHIPLAIFVFGALVWQTVWAFRKQA